MTKPLNTTVTDENLVCYYDPEEQKIVSYQGDFNLWMLTEHCFNESIDCISSFGYTHLDDMAAMVIVWSTESKTSTLYFWHREKVENLKIVGRFDWNTADTIYEIEYDTFNLAPVHYACDDEIDKTWNLFIIKHGGRLCSQKQIP